MVDDRRPRGPARKPPKIVIAGTPTTASPSRPVSPPDRPTKFFAAGGWAALTRGPERRASGAEERGGDFGRSLPQRSPAAPERPLSEPRRQPPADPNGGGASGLSSPGRFGTGGAERSGWWKVLQRFRQPRWSRPPSSTPKEAALREEGADGGPSRREGAEGAAAARHAVMPLACPEPYRLRERVRGGSARRPDGLCAAAWKGDTPLMGNIHPRAWRLVPGGATPVPLGRGAGAVCGIRPYGRHRP
jgi:hypothetical protein